MKLNTAAQMTATPGESTRVDTTVAIEFAASCQPFAKSNIRATTIINRTNANSVVIQVDLHWGIADRGTRSGHPLVGRVRIAESRRILHFANPQSAFLNPQFIWRWSDRFQPL